MPAVLAHRLSVGSQPHATHKVDQRYVVKWFTNIPITSIGTRQSELKA
jgi:hypothetical protein